MMSLILDGNENQQFYAKGRKQGWLAKSLLHEAILPIPLLLFQPGHPKPPKSWIAGPEKENSKIKIPEKD